MLTTRNRIIEKKKLKKQRKIYCEYPPELSTKMWILSKRVKDDPGIKGPRIHGFRENQRKAKKNIFP
jgi:hypothetical protein